MKTNIKHPFGPIASARNLLELDLPLVDNGGKVLFRGQNVDEPLLPRIANLTMKLGSDDPVKIEKLLFENFNRLSIPYLQFPSPKSDWDRLAIARHYGLPTRLLDWTSNAFVALWFAVNTMPPTTTNRSSGVLWVLGANAEDLKYPGEHETPFELARTYIFQPSHIDKRISAQSGWFSIHKYIEKNNKYVPLEKNRGYSQKLGKYLIPYENFPTIREELKRMGFNSFSMYQDLNTLCELLVEELQEKSPHVLS
jgi:hypothetical protein